MHIFFFFQIMQIYSKTFLTQNLLKDTRNENMNPISNLFGYLFGYNLVGR